MSEILVLGGGSMVGSRFVELCGDQLIITSPNSSELDIKDSDALKDYFRKSDAEAVVNFAAYTKVDDAEKESGVEDGLVYRLNALAVRDIAKLCKEMDMYLVQVSTAYVFDGEKDGSPYTENDTPSPINWYGKTKYQGEVYFQESGVRGCIVRIDMPYRAHFDPKQDIARFFLGELQAGRQVFAINDQKVTPAFIDDIAAALTEIVKKQPQGIFHIASTDFTTPYGLARTVADVFDLDLNLVKSTTLAEYSKKVLAQRPQNCWMDTSRFRQMFGENILHSVEGGLEIFKEQVILV